MYSTSDYQRLEAVHPDSLTFCIGKQNPDLQVRIVYDTFSKQNIRLAQDLAARFHGVKLSTVRTDWKDHKPVQFRQRGKPSKKRRKPSKK